MIPTPPSNLELLVNGRSEGTQDVPPYGHVEWRVRHVPGTIEARGYRGGRLVSTSRRETAGSPAAVALRCERRSIGADAEDVAVVAVEIVDARGRVVPTAADEVRFSLRGPARLVGVGNGDPASHESDKGSTRRAFNGACAAILQATRDTGRIRLIADATNLRGAVLEIDALQAAARPYVV